MWLSVGIATVIVSEFHFREPIVTWLWVLFYSNIQMLLSALSRNKIYAELLKKHVYSPQFGIQKSTTNVMPSIPKIQEMIEWAWKQGFDAQGCDQLDGKLYNTKKWIGATEVTALLSSMRIKLIFYTVLYFFIRKKFKVTLKYLLILQNQISFFSLLVYLPLGFCATFIHF